MFNYQVFLAQLGLKIYLVIRIIITRITIIITIIAHLIINLIHASSHIKFGFAVIKFVDKYEQNQLEIIC